MSGVTRNIFWLLGDSLAMKLVGLLVTAFVAARLGPSEFGMLSYVLSTAALFGVVGHLGLQGLVQRELVENPDGQTGILGTVLVLKMGATALGAMAFLSFGLLNPIHVAVEKQLFALLAAMMLMLVPTGLLGIWFHAHTRSRHAVLANQIGVLAAAVAKVFVVLAGAGLFAVALAHAAGITLTATTIWLLFLRDGGPKLMQWRFSISRAKALLSESWMIFLAVAFSTIYLKIDIVMVRSISGTSESGVYAIATMASEAIYFLPASIAVSIIPNLTRALNRDNLQFNLEMQEFLDILAFLGMTSVFILFLSGPPLLAKIFGDEYTGVAPIFLIHIFSIPFVFLRHGMNNWVILKKRAGVFLIAQIFGAVLNVFLNFLVIPIYSGQGAAAVTVFSYAVACYLAVPLSRPDRPLFKMATTSLIMPWRGFWVILKWAHQRKS